MTASLLGRVGRIPTLTMPEPSAGSASVSLAVATSAPSRYVLVAVAAFSPCVSARWCQAKSHEVEIETDEKGEEETPHDRTFADVP